MALWLKYSGDYFQPELLFNDLPVLKGVGFEGVLLPVLKPDSGGLRTRTRLRYFPLLMLMEAAAQAGLKTGLVLDCFHNPILWQNEEFTPPVNSSGVAYLPQSTYFPVCPNNPQSIVYFDRVLAKMNQLPPPDFYYFEHFGYPFFWQNEELDIQLHVPPFCYCPFCITEFSSVVGEIVSTGHQLFEFMPEWLEWRTETMFDMLVNTRDVLANRAKIIVAVPPLSVIDLPFTTGVLPMAYVKEGFWISPSMLYRLKKKSFAWVEDLFEQYAMEITDKRVMPMFDPASAREIQIIRRWEKQFAAIIFHDRQVLTLLK